MYVRKWKKIQKMLFKSISKYGAHSTYIENLKKWVIFCNACHEYIDVNILMMMGVAQTLGVQKSKNHLIIK